MTEKTENDGLPLLGKFTDQNGEQWAFSEDTVCYLETEEGEPFWHFYRFHRIDKPSVEKIAGLIDVRAVTASQCGPEGEP
jgi:hypothetical protein